MTLTVTFKLGTDLDMAQVQVQNRVAQALPRLPEEVRALGVTTQEAVARPHDGRAPDLARRALRRAVPAQLRDAAACKDELARLPGVGDVQRLRRAATTRCASGSTRTRSPRAT